MEGIYSTKITAQVPLPNPCSPISAPYPGAPPRTKSTIAAGLHFPDPPGLGLEHRACVPVPQGHTLV